MSPNKSPNIIKYCVVTSTAALVAIAIPTGISFFKSFSTSVDYVKCEAIFSLLIRTQNQQKNAKDKNREYPSIYSYDAKPYKDVIDKANQDYETLGCFGL